MEQNNAIVKNFSALSPEQRRDARDAVVRTFVRLLALRATDNVYWVGSKVDLAEMAHLAYEDNAVRDAYGQPVPYRRLVRMACARLHVFPPYSPYRLYALARSRKGIKSFPVVERYYYLRHVAGIADPVTSDLEGVREWRAAEERNGRAATTDDGEPTPASVPLSQDNNQ